MDRSYCVYVHTSKNDGRKYIGLTCQAPAARWRNGQGYKGSTHFHNAIMKYGWDSFYHYVIADDLTKQEALDLEAKLISEYQTQNEKYGFNLESGGQAPMHSQETKDKLSKMLKGRQFTDEWLEHMREGFKKRQGHPFTEESKKKLSQSKMGHEVSEAAREKLRNAFSQKVICVELNKVYPSMKVAAEEFGLSKCTISAVIKGRNKTAAGYHWKLYDDSECGTTIPQGSTLK